MYTIAQISDTHIIAGGLFRGIDTCANFETVLAAALAKRPDLLVISGDIAGEAGGDANYRWIKDRLDRCAVPYLAMAGNHDSTHEMRRVFTWPVPLNDPGQIYFKVAHNGWALYFLDSSYDFLPSQQLDWVVDELTQDPRPSVVFVHHPPSDQIAPNFPKKYILHNHTNVIQSLAPFAHIHGIFSGHNHYFHEVTVSGLRLFVTPSTAMQVDPTKMENVPILDMIGYRLIRLEEAQLTTNVEWVSITN